MSIIGSTFNSLEKYLAKTKFERTRKFMFNRTERFIRKFDLPSLSAEEKDMIDEQWKRLPIKPYEDEYRLFKYYARFDSRFITQDLQYPYLYNAINPVAERKALSNKGMYSIYFREMPQPKTIITCIAGTYFNAERKIINNSEAEKIVRSHERCIVKPILETKQGKNIKIFCTQSDDTSALFSDKKGNFIVQEIQGQSALTSQFNPASLNTFRVTTIFLNGVVSTSNVCFKFARNGVQIDNLGHGGLIMGVEEDGHFHDFGVDKDYQKVFTYQEGKKISDIYIPEVSKTIDFAKKYHPIYFPTLTLVGWDIALNSDNQPILIEANLITPGIQAEQYCAQKSVYGDRTEEIIDFVLSNPRHYLFLNDKDNTSEYFAQTPSKINNK